MTEKQLSKVIETLGLIDLGDAILYLDEEGYLEAALSTGPLYADAILTTEEVIAALP